MHIEKRSIESLSAMPISALCDIDLEYKQELERLTQDRSTMRMILSAKAKEEGLSASQAVDRHIQAIAKAQIKGVPKLEIEARD